MMEGDVKITQWQIENAINRMRAIEALKKIKAARKGKRYRIVQVNENTWKEIELK